MIAAAAAILLASTPVAADEAEAATAGMQSAQRAYDVCMNSQRGLADDNGTGPGPTSDAAIGVCRPALESLLLAQQHWVEVAHITDAQRREARRAIRLSLRSLRDAALFPMRAPRFYGQ